MTSDGKGLRVEHYAAQDHPLFALIEGEGRPQRASTHPVFSMPEILERVKENGRRGVQIKRFKGPGRNEREGAFRYDHGPPEAQAAAGRFERRQYAIKADEMFTILMGDVVEPRRQFIEDNALNVQEPGRLTPVDMRRA